MKHLIYLDRDFLYSYYAQAFDGLETSRLAEVTDKTESSKTVDAEALAREISARFLPPIFNIGVKTLAKEAQEHIGFIATEAAREAITVSLHDNALNRVIEHSKALENNEPKRGDYVIVRGNFFMADMESLLDKLQDNVIRSLAQKSWDEHIAELSNPNAPEIQRGKKNYIDNTFKNMASARDDIALICKLAQNNLFLIVQNTIVPLKREYLRETSNEISFKYDGEICVFGRITRFNEDKEPKNQLEVINRTFNSRWPEAMVKLNVLKDNNFTVLSPMAIYFE